MVLLSVNYKTSIFIYNSKNYSNFNIGNEITVLKNKTWDELSDYMIQIPGQQTKLVESLKEEIRHVSFLKVHKTGSSTAQNIFLRFGHSRNLTFALAHSKGGESGWPNVISFRNSITDQNVVPLPPGKIFEILCCHVMYNRTAFEKILPKDTVYTGIVREPFSRFQSAIRMWHPKYIMQAAKDHPVATFAKQPLKYEPDSPNRSWTNNRMALEFGFPVELFPDKDKSPNVEKISEYLKRIDKEFDFIIINERFSESLVYMKMLLGWSVKDILYIDHMKKKNKPSTKELVTKEDKTLLSKFLYLDIALYQFALERFEKQIKHLDIVRFHDQVINFENLNKQVNAFCQTNSKSIKRSIYFNRTKWNDGFSVTKSDCKFLSMSELDFIKIIRLKQHGTVKN